MSTSSYLKSGISSRRNHIFQVLFRPNHQRCILDEEINAFPIRTLREFCLFVTSLHVVDTLVPAKLLKKCYKNGFYLPTSFKDAFDFCKMCYRCQLVGRISRRNMMPLNPILEIELFDVWGIGFMNQFPNLFVNQYILVAVNYVSKWVEVIPSKLMITKLLSSY